VSHASIPLAAAILLTSLGFSPAVAGQNPDFRFVLHAKQSSFEPCDGYLPVDCTSVQPTVNVPAAPIAVFLLLANHQAASGIQTAFDWSGWVLTFAVWEDCLDIHCQFAPCWPNPPGPDHTISGTFNCVNGPALKVIGRMHFVPAGNPGCIRQVQSPYPNGIHVLDCQNQADLITDENSPRLGRVCLGSGGVNACPAAVPVDGATWGKIKATYD
jgi:hypothetical protein